MPTHSQSVLDEHSQGISKQKEIELYYELLSSGHSVGEILDSLGCIQCKSEHRNATTVDHPPSGFDRVAPYVTSEAVLIGATHANTGHISGFTSPIEAESRGTVESRTTESKPLDELGSGTWGQFSGENLLGSDREIVRSPAVHPAYGSETELRCRNQEPPQPGRFSHNAKRIALGALYTVAVASVSIASFAIVRGARIADPAITGVRSSISSDNEAVAIPSLTAERLEAVAEIPKSNKPFVNADASRALELSRTVEPRSAVSSRLQSDTTEVPARFPASTAQIGQATGPSRRPHAPVINHRGAVESETEGSGSVSMSIAKEFAGQQIVRAFYAALEKGNGAAASLLVVPEKRDAGPFSAGELSRFYGRLEQPFRLTELNRAGDNLYSVTYSYKVRNGRFCNGRSLVTTVSLQNQVLIEKIQSPSRC